jgi:hypothetical protein
MAALCGVQVPPGSSKRRGQMATPGERAKADENPENMVCQLGLSNYENGTGGLVCGGPRPKFFRASFGHGCGGRRIDYYESNEKIHWSIPYII